MNEQHVIEFKWRCTYPKCGATSTKGYCREECRPMPSPQPKRCRIDYGYAGDNLVTCLTHHSNFCYTGKVRRCPLGALEDRINEGELT